MNLPKSVPVSVIIPCYKSGGTIRRAIASVMAQSLLPAEIILVDDASIDETFDNRSTFKKIPIKFENDDYEKLHLSQKKHSSKAR